jgi:hypothetical protein
VNLVQNASGHETNINLKVPNFIFKLNITNTKFQLNIASPF